MSLASGTFKKIHAGEDAKPANGEELFLQIMDIKKMPNGRYKVKLNDQDHFMWGLVQAAQNSIFDNNEVISGSVITVTDFIVNAPNGIKMMILKQWNIAQKDCEILGTPVELPQAQKPAAAARPGGFGGGNSGNAGFGGNSGGFGGQTRANNPFGGNSGGGASGGGDSGEFQPVNSLSPFQKTFKIKVRVTRKGDIREWNNTRGSGKLFSVDLLDEAGGEIQATMFNEAAEKFFAVFEEGKVFTVTKGRIKVANKRYTHIKNDYSIDLNEQSEVKFVGEDAKISSQVYEFKPLSDIEGMEDKSFCDTIGICDQVGEVQNFTSSRTQKELTKRTFRLVDKSGAAIECTTWGSFAQSLDPNSLLNQVVALKAAKVSEFNGKSLSVNSVVVNPEDCAETKDLQTWWQTNGSDMKFKSMTQSRGGGGKNEPPITLGDVEEKRFGTSDKADYFNVVATITRIPVDMEKRQPWYKAVPETEGPAYKVTESTEGTGWWCEKLAKNYDSYIPRFIMRAQIADHTGSEWVNMYNDQSEIIMGTTAKALESLWENKQEAEFNKFFKDASHKTWNFRCRARQQEYNGEQSRRVDAVGVVPIDHVADTVELNQKLKELLL